MTAARFRPLDVAAEAVLCTLGLVSDTHMPDRCKALPPALFDALAGCDLLLHAGDVGELWVLDQLSDLAPVIAVHGNDDSPAAQEHLPYEVVLAIGGRRLFLWHSHFPDPRDEWQARQGEAILPKLDRTAARARAAGATLAVFGHWHIPLVVERDGVTVVNPGAIASGNAITRRLRQTAALAWLLRDGGVRVVHLDLGAPPAASSLALYEAAPYDAAVDWEAGFARVLARYEQSILDPALAASVPRWIAGVPPTLLGKLRALLTELAQPVWAGEAPLITAEALRMQAVASGRFAPEELALLEAIAAQSA